MSKVDGLAALELTPKQRIAVEEYIHTSSKTKAALKAGVSPTEASKLFASPVVQQSIAEILGPTINIKCAKVLEEGLDLVDPDKPIEAQRERRMTVESIARMTGQLGPDVAIGIGLGASIDSAEKAMLLMSRFQSNPKESANAIEED